MIVKEEFSIKEEIDDIKQEEQSYNNCIKCNTTINITEGNLCDDCNQIEIISQQYPNVLELLKESQNHLKYSGLNTKQSFIELYKYVESDLIDDIENCHKSNQLLTVLIALVAKRNFYYIDKYRFPCVYVKTVNALSERLKFLWGNAWTTQTTQPFLQELLQENCKKIAILHVITLKINQTVRSNYKILIAYTINGKVFFVSPLYGEFSSFRAIVRNSSILNIFDDDACLIYRLNNNFVKCKVEDFGKQQERIKTAAYYYLNGIANRLENEFNVLKSSFCSYVLLESVGMCFLRQIICACCGLLNYKLALLE